MPAAVRTALAIVLVTLAGVLGGFLSYRHTHPSAGPAGTLRTAPAAGAPLPDSASGAAPGEAGPAARPIPDTVPDLKLPDLAGQPRSLRDYRGHPLIINFWATWCAPCRREMPLLQQLRHSYSADGLQVVGVAVDFRSAVVDYVRRAPVDYPLLIGEDAGLAAAEQFGMQTVLPFSVFADAGGRIVAVKIGELHPDEAAAILAAMRELAAGRVSLADTHAGISERLRQLAVARARSGVKDPE